MYCLSPFNCGRRANNAARDSSLPSVLGRWNGVWRFFGGALLVSTVLLFGIANETPSWVGDGYVADWQPELAWEAERSEIVVVGAPVDLDSCRVVVTQVFKGRVFTDDVLEDEMCTSGSPPQYERIYVVPTSFNNVWAGWLGARSMRAPGRVASAENIALLAQTYGPPREVEAVGLLAPGRIPWTTYLVAAFILTSVVGLLVAQGRTPARQKSRQLTATSAR